VLVAATVASATPSVALLGRSPRYEGLVTVALYAGCLAAGARHLGPARRPELSRDLVRLATVAAVAVATLAIAETAGLRPLASNVARPGSLLGNASDEGALGVLLLGPLGSAALVLRDRWAVLGSVAAALVVVLSASRGAMLGAVAVLVTLGVLGVGRRARLLALGAIVVVVLAVLAVPTARDRVLLDTPSSGATASGRVLL
jgi:hypothetical protein